MDKQNLQPRKVFSRLGIGMCVMLALAMGIQFLWFRGPQWLLGTGNTLAASRTWDWFGNLIPMYCIAMPSFYLVVRSLPKTEPVDQKLGTNRYWTLLPICFFVMYAGNIIGNLLSALITGGQSENFVQEAILDNHPLKYIMVLVVAPVMEELMFRKVLLDRTQIYGEKTAVILSGILFGLFHQNLYQFFYAFGLGILLAYMYVRSARIRYSILTHGIINFIGSVIAPLMLQVTEHPALTDPASADPMQTLMMVPLMLLASAFSTGIIGMFICGIVMFCKQFKKATWNEAPDQLPRGQVFRVVYGNVGMILFVLVCGALTVLIHFI